jgi:hypothetical protein
VDAGAARLGFHQRLARVSSQEKTSLALLIHGDGRCLSGWLGLLPSGRQVSCRRTASFTIEHHAYTDDLAHTACFAFAHRFRCASPIRSSASSIRREPDAYAVSSVIYARADADLDRSTLAHWGSLSTRLRPSLLSKKQDFRAGQVETPKGNSARTRLSSHCRNSGVGSYNPDPAPGPVQVDSQEAPACEAS